MLTFCILTLYLYYLYYDGLELECAQVANSTQILVASHVLTNQTKIQHNLDYHVHKEDNHSLQSGCQSMATSIQLIIDSGIRTATLFPSPAFFFLVIQVSQLQAGDAEACGSLHDTGDNNHHAEEAPHGVRDDH